MQNKDSLDFKNMQVLREKKNITQVKLSLMVGVSQQSITYYEQTQGLHHYQLLLKLQKH